MTTGESQTTRAATRPHVLRRWWRRLVRAAALTSAAVLIVLAALSVIIVRYGKQDRAQVADVIIVLGGGDAGTTRRAEHGAVLYAQGYAPFLLCTGGVESGALTEARRCAQTLVASGVPDSAILLDEHSRNTEENAIESRAIMARHGWQSAVLVSDDFHLWRARWLYHERDITVYPSPAQVTAGPLDRFESVYSVLRELVAVGWHVGRLALGLN